MNTQNENKEGSLQEKEETLDAELNSGELEKLRIELLESKEQIIRVTAEMDNQRKRLEREVENAGKFAIQDFITRLLPAKDSMEKGLDVAYMEDGIDGEALFEGMTSTLKICTEAFKTEGVEEINPLGKSFDPELHEAMSVKQTVDKQPNIVLSVFQKGYLLNGRLIRPARVEVSASN